MELWAYYARLQAELLIAEQSLEYGDITLKQIHDRLEKIEERFKDSDHGEDAYTAYETETLLFKEDRNALVIEIEEAASLAKKLRETLKEAGSMPYAGELTREMKTLGARLSLLHSLAEVPGFSPQRGFSAKTVEHHLLLREKFAKIADECMKRRSSKDFISAKAAYYFYAMAERILKEL